MIYLIVFCNLNIWQKNSKLLTFALYVVIYYSNLLLHFILDGDFYKFIN